MKTEVAIIGGGPAAMMVAAKLNPNLFDVSLYEKNQSLGRKFLVAGKGGFNLTHSEDFDTFFLRYTPSTLLEDSLKHFNNSALQKWFLQIGITTYTGTSKRIFPSKGIKPIQVLNAILNNLKKQKVSIYTNYNWKGFDNDNTLLFDTPAGTKRVKSQLVIFALGGASWRITGSDGLWLNYFRGKGINCIPFAPSNCALAVNWPANFLNKTEGLPLKNCVFKCGEKEHAGEAVFTQFGIEGSGIYPLSGEVRQQLEKNNEAVVYIDMKPQVTENEILKRFHHKGKTSVTDFLISGLKLKPVNVQLLKNFLNKSEFTNFEVLSKKIKKIPIRVISMAPIDEAISTVGGISLEEVDAHFQLKKLPDHYVIGEMLNWDAPTGGYLLQACFSMGESIARRLNSVYAG